MAASGRGDGWVGNRHQHLIWNRWRGGNGAAFPPAVNAAPFDSKRRARRKGRGMLQSSAYQRAVSRRSNQGKPIARRFQDARGVSAAFHAPKTPRKVASIAGLRLETAAKQRVFRLKTPDLAVKMIPRGVAAFFPPKIVFGKKKRKYFLAGGKGKRPPPRRRNAAPKFTRRESRCHSALPALHRLDF